MHEHHHALAGYVPGGTMCLKGNNPNYGITSFDNIEYSWLTIFQCVTLEGWTPIMYMAMDAVTGLVRDLLCAAGVHGGSSCSTWRSP